MLEIHKKKIALALIGSFLCSQIPLKALEAQTLPATFVTLPTQSINRDPSIIDIPLQHCTVKEFHRGTNGKFIIHIQDAHMNYSGQMSLASILDFYMSKYGYRLVLSEGSAKDSTLNDVKEIASGDEWRIAAKRLLMDGVIKGEEYLNLTSDHPIKIMGIERKHLYGESLKAYAELAQERKNILLYIHQINQSIQRVKNRIYTKNILKYEEQKSHDEGNLQASLKALLSLAEKANVPIEKSYPETHKLAILQQKERLINFNQANREQSELLRSLSEKGAKHEVDEFIKASRLNRNRQIEQFVLISQLFRMAGENQIGVTYPELKKYREYLRDISEVHMSVLLMELDRLEDETYRQILTSESARKIRAIERFVGLLEKAYRIRLASYEFEMLHANEEDFKTKKWQAFLNEQLRHLGYIDDLVPYKPCFENAKEKLHKFYSLVDQRDEAFLGNASRIMNEQSVDVAFLIAGGYHTNHLTKILRDSDYSYMVLTPVVTSETDHQKYERHLLEGMSVQDRGGSTEDEAVSDTLRSPLLKAKVAARLAQAVEGGGYFLSGAKVRRLIEIVQNSPEDDGARMAVSQNALGDQYALFDEVLVEELAKERGVSIDDLEADFERTVTMLEERIQYHGYVDPEQDQTAKRIHSIFKKLATAYQSTTGAWPGNFAIVDDNTVNAFVIRNRTDVYFYKGLYETLHDISVRMNVPLTEDMIAFIIAHELSHSMQHSSHQGLNVRDFDESTAPYLIQMIKNGEYDADMRALELMDKAGYSIFGAVDAMTFLEFITESGQAENVLSSHPYVSLRKHRLSQIIFDQRTNVFTHVKAPRVPLTGTGRMKSRDMDFRMIMDKEETDLLSRVDSANNVDAMDELAGMIVLRRRMNALSSLPNEEYLRTSFLRHIYMQAVITAVISHTGTDITFMPDHIDYGNMRQAAAVHDFGHPVTAGSVSQEPSNKFTDTPKDMASEVMDSLSHHTSDRLVEARKIINGLVGAIKREANRIDHRSFDDFLHPREEVEDLMRLFTFDKADDIQAVLSDDEKREGLDLDKLRSAIRDPMKLISAYLYANYLAQEPSTEFGIPTTEVRVRLQRRNNYVYLEDPSYRDVQSSDNRKSLQKIILLHYAMKKTGRSVFDDYLRSDYPGIERFTSVPPIIAGDLFVRYFQLFSNQHSPQIAIQLAGNRIKEYFGHDMSDISSFPRVAEILSAGDSADGFVNDLTQKLRDLEKRAPQHDWGEDIQQEVSSFVAAHPLIQFIRQSIEEFRNRLPSDDVKEFEEEMAELKDIQHYSPYRLKRIVSAITESIALVHAVSPRRSTSASSVFVNETRLDYYLKEVKITSLESLMSLPDWAVSDYLKRNKYDFGRMVKNALKDDMPLEKVFEFMKSRLPYEDRRKVFEALFFGYDAKPIYLFDYFESKLNNDANEIILLFLGLFSKNDALKLMAKFAQESLYKKAKDADQGDKAILYESLTIDLLEYIYSQTSKAYHPDKNTAKVYLDLINDRIERSGQSGNEAYVNERVYEALMVLIPAVDLKLEMSCSNEVSKDGSPDFKTKVTSLLPEGFRGQYTRYESNAGLHNFGWNDEDPSHQSVFVTHMTDLSIDQLKNLLRQRWKYVETRTDVEYRGEVFSASGLNDFFANMVTLILLKKIKDEEGLDAKEHLARLDDLIKIEVRYGSDSKTKETKVYSPHVVLKISKSEANPIPYDKVMEHLVGVAIPSGDLDPVWETYIESNVLIKHFPELVPLLQNPNVGNELIYDPIAFLKKHKYSQKVSYRKVVQKFFMDSSVYARLFNMYSRGYGRGYVCGQYKPLSERLAWAQRTLPNKSIIKDSLIDLWETDVFPELIANMPELVKLARTASGEGEELRDMWTILGEMDDDVGRLQRLNELDRLSPERIHELIAFYESIIPLTLSPQKIARYGATAYTLWRQLPENRNLSLSVYLDSLIHFMPEPSVLRDELLMKLANQHVKHMNEAPLITSRLYSNNLLASERDLRTEDFVSETILHLFGGAKIEDRRDVLLWIVGERDKPKFVVDIEKKHNIDFTTLPMDIRLLPSSMREKFIEGFMLGDNGVLDPQNDTDRSIMSDFLERLFAFIFPKGMKGIGEEELELMSKVFLIVMQSFPPYRRVQVIKALAELRVKAGFERIGLGERFAVLLGAMGPAGIKVAQYLSENETLVPDESMRSSLGALRHKAPEITKISAVSVLENEVPLCHVLVREIGDPVGVASIKQVNRGKWIDINALANAIVKKAPPSDATQVKAKVVDYQAKRVSTLELVEYLVQKANEYSVSYEDVIVSVVYKIRRPNMETTIGVDFAALDAVARELRGTVYKGEELNLDDLTQTVKGWISLEKNFKNEVKFHNGISQLDYSWATDLEAEAKVKVTHPRVLYATESLIVEEEIQGVPILSLTDSPQPISIDDVVDAGYERYEAERILDRLEQMEPRKARIILSLKKSGFEEASLENLAKQMQKLDYTQLQNLLRHLLLHQMFVDGLFHADLHQGNVLVTPNGELVMIDRGNIGALNQEQITGAKILLKGLLLRDKTLIKQGIDHIFQHAQYPEGVAPAKSQITLQDIQDVLDQGHDLKMTMNTISMRAVRGSKDTQGGKDFSTFLKAFTQAMYLFPTDIAHGMDTLNTISQYVDMTPDEAALAAQEQAKYVVVKDAQTRANQAQTKVDIVQITKRIFYERTNSYFMHAWWQPIAFRLLSIPLTRLLKKTATMSHNILGIARMYGRQIINDHIDELIARKDFELVDAAKEIISTEYTEQYFLSYAENNLRQRKFGRYYTPIAMVFLRKSMFIVRPFLGMVIEATKEWLETDGRQYVENIAPQMTVHESVGLLAQVFGEDFADIEQKFDQSRNDIVDDQGEGARLALPNQGSRMAEVGSDRLYVRLGIENGFEGEVVFIQMTINGDTSDALRYSFYESITQSLNGVVNFKNKHSLRQAVMMPSAVGQEIMPPDVLFRPAFEPSEFMNSVSWSQNKAGILVPGTFMDEATFKTSIKQVSLSQDVTIPVLIELRGKAADAITSLSTELQQVFINSLSKFLEGNIFVDVEGLGALDTGDMAPKGAIRSNIAAVGEGYLLRSGEGAALLEGQVPTVLNLLVCAANMRAKNTSDRLRLLERRGVQESIHEPTIELLEAMSTFEEVLLVLLSEHPMKGLNASEDFVRAYALAVAAVVWAA